MNQKKSLKEADKRISESIPHSIKFSKQTSAIRNSLLSDVGNHLRPSIQTNKISQLMGIRSREEDMLKYSYLAPHVGTKNPIHLNTSQKPSHLAKYLNVYWVKEDRQPLSPSPISTFGNITEEIDESILENTDPERLKTEQPGGYKPGLLERHLPESYPRPRLAPSADPILIFQSELTMIYKMKWLTFGALAKILSFSTILMLHLVYLSGASQNKKLLFASFCGVILGVLSFLWLMLMFLVNSPSPSMPLTFFVLKLGMVVTLDLILCMLNSCYC